MANKCVVGLSCGKTCVEASDHCSSIASASILGKIAKSIKASDGSDLKDDFSERSLDRAKVLISKWSKLPDSSETEMRLGNLSRNKDLILANRPLLNDDNARVVMRFFDNKKDFSSDKALSEHLDHALYRLPPVNNAELYRVAKLSPSARAELLSKYESLANAKLPLIEQDFLSAKGREIKVNSEDLIKYHIKTLAEGSKAKDISDYTGTGGKDFVLGRNSTFSIDKVNKVTGEVWMTERKPASKTELETLAKAPEIAIKSKFLPKSDDAEAYLNSKRDSLVKSFGKDKVDKAEAEAQSVLNNAKLNIAINESTFHSIITSPDGRFKNMFELPASSDKDYRSTRLSIEASVLGLSKRSSKNDRPIYGYLADDSYSGLKNSTNAYGSVHVTLKPEVKDRATVTDHDSFATSSRPSPIAKANIATFTRLSRELGTDDNVKGITDLLRTRPKPDSFIQGYLEAQIYGKVKISDIESVTLHKSDSVMFKQTIAKLDELGVPYKYHD